MVTNAIQLEQQTRRTFDRFANRVPYTLDERMDNTTRLTLAAICRRVDLWPLLNDVRIRVVEELPVPFRAVGMDILELEASSLQVPELAAFYLRYGLELLILERALQGRDQNLKQTVRAILGFSLAVSYLEGMSDHEKRWSRANLPQWLTGAIETASTTTSQSGSSGDCVDTAIASLEKLLAFQVSGSSATRLRSSGCTAQEQAFRISRDLLRLARPTEQLLTEGGDTRSLVGKPTGLNLYGCSPRPRPSAITFSSSTATSVSDMAYREAEFLRQSLLSKGFESGFAAAFNVETQKIRRSIADLLLRSGTRGAKVVLTPSGTHAELYALQVVLGLSDKPITSIVISSTEAGSGTTLAAGGRHFDERTPLGCDVAKGDALEGLDAGRVSVEVIELRDDSGSMKDAGSLDREVSQLVAKAATEGRLALLHLLDSSKTGAGGPTIGAVLDLKERFRSSLLVLADAAQMRLSRDCLNSYLENEFMVIITGSKFFTGPPFSGALIVPPKLAGDISERLPFPTGLAGYATTYDFPAVWRRRAAGESGHVNVGLLLRWQAALWEMRAFYSVEPTERYLTIKTFGDAILDAINQNPDLQLVSAPVLERGDKLATHWDQLPSIFTFLLLRRDGTSGRRVPLTIDEARFVYQCMNRDIARFLPVTATEREHHLAAKPCHMGQPVKIKQAGDAWIGGLRIAAGARLVSGVQYDRAMGDTPARRLHSQIQAARLLLEKLSVIVRYWQELDTFDLRHAARTSDRESAGDYQGRSAP